MKIRHFYESNSSLQTSQISVPKTVVILIIFFYVIYLNYDIYMKYIVYLMNFFKITQILAQN